MSRGLPGFILGAIGILLTVTVAAESHRIDMLRAGILNGVELKTGQYKLVLNDEGEAEIYRGKKLMVKAKVEILPLGGGTPGSIIQDREGTLKEIRLSEQKILFVDSQ
jgi:hypothetical protein